MASQGAVQNFSGFRTAHTLAVFVTGLMVGRTPEFLGKKIRGPQMKLIVAYVLTIPLVTLVLGSISLVIPAGTLPSPVHWPVFGRMRVPGQLSTPLARRSPSSCEARL